MLNESHLPDKTNVRLFSNAGRLLDLAVKRAKTGGGAACVITELREIAMNAGFRSSRKNPANCPDAVVKYPAGEYSNNGRDENDLLGDTNVLVTCQGSGDFSRGLHWSVQRYIDPHLFQEHTNHPTTKHLICLL
jgi:hypothetical protein